MVAKEVAKGIPKDVAKDVPKAELKADLKALAGEPVSKKEQIHAEPKAESADAKTESAKVDVNEA